MTPCCPIGARLDAPAIDAALQAIGQPGAESLSAMGRRLDLAKSSLHAHRKHLVQPVQSPTERVAEWLGTPLNAPPNVAPITAPASSPFSVPNPGDDAPTAPRKVIAATVERRCVELRVKGKAYEAIAEELGIDPDTAMDAVERVLLRTRGKADELAEAARAIEVRRCDAIIASFWERATDPGMVEVLVPADNEAGVKKYDGQDKAADRLLKAMERRAKLLGLDAPAGPLVSIQVLLTSPDWRRLQEALVSALRPWPEALAAAVKALRGVG